MQSLKQMLGMRVAIDEKDAGRVTDFILNEPSWTVCYAVVPAGGVLSGKQWLLPLHLATVRSDGLVLMTSLSILELDSTTPDSLITRSQEGRAAVRNSKTPHTSRSAIDEIESPWRSFNVLLGSHIETSDGGFGMVNDVLLTRSDWRAKYLVGYSYDWKRKPRVLIPIPWVKHVSWSGDTIDVGASRSVLMNNDPSFKSASHA